MAEGDMRQRINAALVYCIYTETVKESQTDGGGEWRYAGFATRVNLLLWPKKAGTQPVMGPPGGVAVLEAEIRKEERQGLSGRVCVFVCV